MNITLTEVEQYAEECGLAALFDQLKEEESQLEHDSLSDGFQIVSELLDIFWRHTEAKKKVHQMLMDELRDFELARSGITPSP